MSEQRKGKVARTPNDNTRECRLTRRQFESLANHEQVAEYFSANISRRAQADFFNGATAALTVFANSLPAR